MSAPGLLGNMLQQSTQLNMPPCKVQETAPWFEHDTSSCLPFLGDTDGCKHQVNITLSNYLRWAGQAHHSEGHYPAKCCTSVLHRDTFQLPETVASIASNLRNGFPDVFDADVYHLLHSYTETHLHKGCVDQKDMHRANVAERHPRPPLRSRGASEGRPDPTNRLSFPGTSLS
jgi:hypothetical protein